jgi:hypothetical protein
MVAPGAALTGLRGHHANDVRLGEGSHCCRSSFGLQRCTRDAAFAYWSRHLHGVSSDIPRRHCACERSCDISSEPTLRAALQAASYTEQFYQYRFQRKRGRCRCELPLPCSRRPRTPQAKHPNLPLTWLSRTETLFAKLRGICCGRMLRSWTITPEAILCGEGCFSMLSEGRTRPYRLRVATGRSRRSGFNSGFSRAGGGIVPTTVDCLAALQRAVGISYSPRVAKPLRSSLWPLAPSSRGFFDSTLPGSNLWYARLGLNRLV